MTLPNSDMPRMEAMLSSFEIQPRVPEPAQNLPLRVHETDGNSLPDYDSDNCSTRAPTPLADDSNEPIVVTDGMHRKLDSSLRIEHDQIPNGANIVVRAVTGRGEFPIESFYDVDAVCFFDELIDYTGGLPASPSHDSDNDVRFNVYYHPQVEYDPKAKYFSDYFERLNADSIGLKGGLAIASWETKKELSNVVLLKDWVPKAAVKVYEAGIAKDFEETEALHSPEVRRCLTVAHDAGLNFLPIMNDDYQLCEAVVYVVQLVEARREAPNLMNLLAAEMEIDAAYSANVDGLGWRVVAGKMIDDADAMFEYRDTLSDDAE